MFSRRIFIKVVVLNKTFVKPRYDSGGFAGIPNRVKNAFASQKYDAVVLFFIDAFGWRFYERFQDNAFIKRIAKYGKIEKLTSQFPSTTAAHVTTMHTGLPVGMSGVHEWYYYEPQVDRIISPLLFSFAGTKERDTLNTKKVNAATIYPKGILYPELKRWAWSRSILAYAITLHPHIQITLWQVRTYVPSRHFPKPL